MLSSLTTAIRTLTILPCPGNETKNLADAFCWFGFVALILGAIPFGLLWLFEIMFDGLWVGAASLLVVFLGIFLTRGLHLDGLSDFADGFFGAWQKENVLLIMKDSQLGTFGVLALIVVVLGKWVAISRLIEEDLITWIIVSYVISRTMQVELAFFQPYARQQGKAINFIQGITVRHLIIVVLTSCILLYFLVGLSGFLIFGLASFLTYLFGLWCKKRVGGVTGDLLGAVSELMEILVLFFPIIVKS